MGTLFGLAASFAAWMCVKEYYGLRRGTTMAIVVFATLMALGLAVGISIDREALKGAAWSWIAPGSSGP